MARCRGAKLLSLLVLTQVVHPVRAQTPVPAPRVPTPTMPQTRVPDLPVETPPVEGPEEEYGSSWLDRGHRSMHALLWRSAMKVDSWFGGTMPAHSYADETRGSITPVLLWDEFNGFDDKLRFRVKMPLPYAGDKFNAFFGTFTRDEFVTERDQASGAIPRQRAGGRTDQDQTLVGIQYRERKGAADLLDKAGGQFGADVGLHIRTPLDPFVKAGYRYLIAGEDWRAVFKETAFWQNSEKFGFTSRLDLETILNQDWLARWTTSATISQRTEGVRGYVAATFFRDLANRQAIAGQVFTTAEFDARVPVEEYGFRVAYRRSIARDWLVLEVRPSLTWPKDDPDEPRKASWGIGIGLEMFFGMDEFQGRPVTF